MKFLKIITLFFAFLLGVYTVNAQSETCSDFKIKHFSKRNPEMQKKYKEKASFQYDIKYHRLEFFFPNIDNQYINGAITSYFIPVSSGFNEISFDLTDNMQVDSVLFHQNKLTVFTLTNDELTINLETTIPENVLDSITVFYQGVPDAGGLGSFKQSMHNGNPIIWTLSEPYGAKDWWPCKQSLDDKIDSIDVYVTNPEAYKAASNGLLLSETVDNGMKTAHWKHRHSIAAYLIAIAVTNYVSYSDFVTLTTGENVEVLNYIFPEDLSYAQANTPNVLDVIQLYSDLFIPYPFADEKYGHAEFGWGGGMEHQTMSFMAGFSHHLMAHELAHQWFGDFVTCGSWHDIWLNEGFATYLDGMTHEHNLNDDGVSFDDWKQDNINTIVSQPDGSVYVDDTTSINRIFSGRLSYDKGAMVLHMLRKYVGDTDFFGGITNYLNDLGNGYARTSDLKSHLETTYGNSLTEFFNDWYYGEGYPIYDIYYSQNQNKNVTVTINQTQSHNSVGFFNMKIPVKFEGIDKDTTIWFDNNTNGEQYMFNLNFNVTAAQFDPNNDIISSGSTTLKIDTFDKTNKVFVLPNPARNKITITFLEKINPDKIVIYSNIGSIAKTFSKNKQSSYKFEFDISDLPAGMYYVSFYEEGKQISKKFVKN
ncbi:MAG: hypothetical protein B6D61_10485 [Bacteroidetes bacterium 4484_249]|nr:MAG: hypothetical protein B6D61_10485 [Bacteroidetes bacterium 4484_249]RLD51069.1 MAG: peptidase M1 [Bacteroidota bacterium]